MGARRTVSPGAFRRIAWWALAAQIGIVVTGAAVRLTGSGLGCTDWPGCTEDRLVPEWGFHHWVEFGNRLLTFAVTAAAVLAVVGALRRVPRRRGLIVLGAVLVGGVVAQALIGAVLVIFELDPRLTVLHFVTSMVLISAGVVLVHRSAADGGLTRPSLVGGHLDSTGGAGERAGDTVRRLTALLTVAAAAVVGTGTVVTGSGPHGGDERADRFGFALTTIARVHSGAMWLFILVLAAVTVTVLRADGPVSALRPNVHALLALTAGQGVIGYLQYALGVPAGLVAVHVLGSTLVWAATLALLLRAWSPSGADTGRAGEVVHPPGGRSRPVLSDR